MTGLPLQGLIFDRLTALKLMRLFSNPNPPACQSKLQQAGIYYLVSSIVFRNGPFKEPVSVHSIDLLQIVGIFAQGGTARIREADSLEVNSWVQPSPSISRPCTARVCLYLVDSALTQGFQRVNYPDPTLRFVKCSKIIRS